MTTLAIWLEGARPKTWVATFAPLLISGALIWHHPLWNLTTYLITALCALCIQIGTNFANDYLDYLKGGDRDDRCGPRRLAEARLASVVALKRVTWMFFGLAALLASYLASIGGWPIALLALVSIALGFLYTGGPYPLSYLGLGDLFAFMFFGPIATAGTVYLQLREIPPEALIAGIAPGCFSTALLLANNLRDEKSDRRAGKKTLPVRWGARVGKGAYLACLCGAALTPLWLVLYTKGHVAALLASGFLLAAGPVLAILREKNPKAALADLLPKTAQLFLVYTLMFLCTWQRSL